MVINPIFGCHNKQDGLMKVKKSPEQQTKLAGGFNPVEKY